MHTPFVRDAWYCAAFAEELTPRGLKSVRVLGEPLVLFRGDDGNVAALTDRCVHRFAPLSKGKVCGNAVQCPYHGLQYDASGTCIHNPHGQGAIPKTAVVRAYVTLEKHGAIWVWMGEPAKAQAGTLPDFALTDARPGWARVQGYLHVRANYQLIIDNLLDLSHVPFLHPFLSSDAPPPPQFRAHITTEQQGDTVRAINEYTHMPNSSLYRLLWERGEVPDYVEMRANMRWDPPSVLLLDTGAVTVGRPRAEGPSIPSSHWLTPETETTTHYFWAATRDTFVSSVEINAQVATGIGGAFRNEDEPMIESCQQNMGTTDLMSLKPVLLKTDAAAIKARRVVERLIKSEGASQPERSVNLAQRSGGA